mgnify:FL=1
MELKRKIYEKILSWKNTSRGQTALLIEGARRIGKSTIAEKFAKENYKSYVIIDFAIVSKKIKDSFNENANKLDILFQDISLEYNVRLYNKESLIIFDEVQRFPKAREMIKYLVKDGRYDYIETGSLISIKENVENIVIPSEEEKIKMYPLDFEEFLVAANEEILLDYIKDCFDKKIPLKNEFHKKAMRLFNEYILVGGMPQSVVKYFENNRDFEECDNAKRQILSLYKDDIKKAEKKYRLKVASLFDNIPNYLSTHEKKISFNKTNKRIDYFDNALFWLDDSMMCLLCYKCLDPNVGFALNKDDSAVKCYFCDTGLLFSLAFSKKEIASGNLYKNIINGKSSLNKGMLFENVVAQELVSKENKLYFYTHYSEEKHRNDIEIDFLLSNGSKTNLKVIPVEVKSSKNYTKVSFDKFKEKFSKRIDYSIIIHPKQFSIEGKNIKIPPYMTFCL